jgi:hypothetical protein
MYFVASLLASFGSEEVFYVGREWGYERVGDAFVFE